jgi:hypothetical protein
VGRGRPIFFVSINVVSSHYGSAGTQPASHQAHDFHKAGHLGGKFDVRDGPAID